MEEKLYTINVSGLEVRKVPSEAGKTTLKRSTVVKATGKSKQFRKETWIEITTLSEPVVTGYVQLKYLTKI